MPVLTLATALLHFSTYICTFLLRITLAPIFKALFRLCSQEHGAQPKATKIFSHLNRQGRHFLFLLSTTAGIYVMLKRFKNRSSLTSPVWVQRRITGFPFQPKMENAVLTKGSTTTLPVLHFVPFETHPGIILLATR